MSVKQAKQELRHAAEQFTVLPGLTDRPWRLITAAAVTGLALSLVLRRDVMKVAWRAVGWWVGHKMEKEKEADQ